MDKFLTGLIAVTLLSALLLMFALGASMVLMLLEWQI